MTRRFFPASLCCVTQYHAIATRDGDHWLVQVPGAGKIGYAEDDEGAVSMARFHIAVLHDVPAEGVEVQVTFREPVPAPWDAMVDAAMEIMRRDSGYPSVADMDREMPAWREQCEEIVTAMLAILLGQVESPLEDDGRRCPRCNPDNTCTLWCFDAMIAEDTPAMVRELFKLRRERDSLTAALGASESNDLVGKYTELLAEFNKLAGERCGVVTCDHLASVHSDMGCEFCPCPRFARKATP